jgi:hypothetical protein
MIYGVLPESEREILRPEGSGLRMTALVGSFVIIEFVIPGGARNLESQVFYLYREILRYGSGGHVLHTSEVAIKRH